jgi:hypothetical protein
MGMPRLSTGIGIVALAGTLSISAQTQTSQQSVTWEMQEFNKALPGCQAKPITRCAAVHLSYPVIETAPTDEAKQTIEHQIEDMLLTPLEKGKAPDSPEEFAGQILDHYQTWLKKGGSPTKSWAIERKIDVHHNSPNALCLKFFQSVEQGDGRVAKNTVYFNFSPHDGSMIQLSDLIDDSQWARFAEIAKQHYQKQAPPANEEEEGEQSKAAGQEFEVPKNFAIEADGLRFRYEEDQTDTRPNVTPEFVVPYREIRSLLHPDVKLP